MKDGFLKVGVASVDVEVANPIHNKEKVMEVIKKADKNGVKLLVFPELVLTAYTCNDLFLQKTLLDEAKNQLFAILEETKGNLPLWLAPVQAKILPVKNEDEELNAYSHDLYKYLDDNGIRVEIDERNEKLGYRIREAQMEKVPYLLVLGKNEAADGTVSYRLHGEQNSTTVSREDFLALLKEDIRTKKINPAALK